MKLIGKKIALYSISLILFLNSISLKANAMDYEEVQAYSNFITNLIYDIEFEREGKFCIFGSDDIAKDLAIKFPKALNINEVNLNDTYRSCNLVYISQGSERGLRIELEKISRNKIVTIAIFESFIALGGTMQIQIGRRNFEITTNPVLLKNSGAKLGVLATNLIIN